MQRMVRQQRISLTTVGFGVLWVGAAILAATAPALADADLFDLTYRGPDPDTAATDSAPTAGSGSPFLILKTAPAAENPCKLTPVTAALAVKGGVAYKSNPTNSPTTPTPAFVTSTNPEARVAIPLFEDQMPDPDDPKKCLTRSLTFTFSGGFNASWISGIPTSNSSDLYGVAKGTYSKAPTTLEFIAKYSTPYAQFFHTAGIPSTDLSASLSYKLGDAKVVAYTPKFAVQRRWSENPAVRLVDLQASIPVKLPLTVARFPGGASFALSPSYSHRAFDSGRLDDIFTVTGTTCFNLDGAQQSSASLFAKYTYASSNTAGKSYSALEAGLNFGFDTAKQGAKC